MCAEYRELRSLILMSKVSRMVEGFWPQVGESPLALFWTSGICQPCRFPRWEFSKCPTPRILDSEEIPSDSCVIRCNKPYPPHPRSHGKDRKSEGKSFLYVLFTLRNLYSQPHILTDKIQFLKRNPCIQERQSEPCLRQMNHY